ncbi:MAG: Cof-type HAD-IIB family hydrolase [Nitrosopumilus sp.]|nr:Cof-type HAD-IIB family hydrolase [Nitrosopumilus sp.]MDA7943120.1 Cof-type HAD-IIB family hydrolase [Nitrosopumilus sp.]
MFLYGRCKVGKAVSAKASLRRTGLFSEISFDRNKFMLETKEPVLKSEKTKMQKILEKLEKIDAIESTPAAYPDYASEEKGLFIKDIHVFIDIDSTLTRPHQSNIDRNAKQYIDRFRERGAAFYFCSGRSRPYIERLMDRYNTSEYAIAENGGIIIGMVTNGVLGNIDQPNKLLEYLRSRPETASVMKDPKQNVRETEVVLLKSTLDDALLRRAIRLSKAKVEYHAGNHTYHITARGVNKGSAISILTERLNLGSRLNIIVAVGDSMLDIPMFEQADRAFVVKPNTALKRKIKRYGKKITVLPGPPVAIKKLYECLFPYT